MNAVGVLSVKRARTRFVAAMLTYLIWLGGLAAFAYWSGKAPELKQAQQARDLPEPEPSGK